MDLKKICEERLTSCHWLPNETVCFNPSNGKDVEGLVSKYGPEGAWEIAQVLLKKALADMEVG